MIQEKLLEAYWLFVKYTDRKPNLLLLSRLSYNDFLSAMTEDPASMAKVLGEFGQIKILRSLSLPKDLIKFGEVVW